VAGISFGARNLLYWDHFQGRCGEPKRPFLIFRPVQIPFSAPSTERWDRESLEERALLTGWVPYTKRALDSIKKLTLLSQDRFIDKEFGKVLYQRIAEDVEKADLLLDNLLDYFRVTTPIEKTDTVNTLIEEALRKSQAQLEEKGVKLFKKLEKDLPEIIVPDEQLKYILDSVLRYLITSTLPNGTIELLTKSFIFQRGEGEAYTLFEEYAGYIEILVVFVDDKKPEEKSEVTSGRIPSFQKDEALEFMLRLAKEVVLKNRGMMKFEADEKRGKKMISLEFPIERRK
jgi:hypothetical protein